MCCRFKAARIEAEALVWHHGSRGVAIAVARAEAGDSAEHDVWCYRQSVARLAKQRFEMLNRADTATRYEIVEDWSRRPGQMIRPTLS